MKDIAKRIMAIAAVCASAAGAQAVVHLPNILSDGMIVQRGEPVRLWGTADPGETVSARVDKKKQRQ